MLHALLFDESDSLLGVALLLDVVFCSGERMLRTKVLHVVQWIELGVAINMGLLNDAPQLLPVVLQLNHVAPV